MKLKVTRKVEFKTEDICVGDQITVKLKGYGKYTATAQRVTADGVLFLFDDVIARSAMNSSDTNEGGFDKSNIARWLDDVLLPSFPAKLRNKVREITLPTYGEIFGLRNATKKEVSSAYFAYVVSVGVTNFYSALYSYGVRPEFWLVR